MWVLGGHLKCLDFIPINSCNFIPSMFCCNFLFYSYFFIALFLSSGQRLSLEIHIYAQLDSMFIECP